MPIECNASDKLQVFATIFVVVIDDCIDSYLRWFFSLRIFVFMNDYDIYIELMLSNSHIWVAIASVK